MKTAMKAMPAKRYRFSIHPPCVALLLAVMGFFVSQLGELVSAEEPSAPDNRRKTEVQIEDEYAEKVEKYNELLKQNRFEEALIVAKQAQLLQPENPTSELMVLKARLARQQGIKPARRLVDFERVADDQALHQAQARIEDGALDRFVFGEQGAAVRTLLDARLGSKIAAVDRICRLTSTQKERLELAGRGDIKRLFDSVDALQPQFHEDHVDDREVQIWALKLSVEAGAIRWTLKSNLFEKGSHFAKALKTTLTADQAATYAAAPPTPPEGSLVRWVDPVGKKVWIGLGEADGVQPRTIYRISKKPRAQRPGEPRAEGADEWIKATIEVTRVLEANLSEARIVKEDAGNPIAKGDPIAPQPPKAR